MARAAGLYHPTTGAYVGQLDDNGNEQMVVSAFPSDQGTASQTVVLTQAQYDALVVKDPVTLYLIVG